VQKRRGFTPEGRERVRAATLSHQPWRYSTGPRTPAGKARSAANGKITQKGEKSVWELRAELAEVWRLIRRMRDRRGQLDGG
jgi:hypothetical protein